MFTAVSGSSTPFGADPAGDALIVPAGGRVYLAASDTLTADTYSDFEVTITDIGLATDGDGFGLFLTTSDGSAQRGILWSQNTDDEISAFTSTGAAVTKVGPAVAATVPGKLRMQSWPIAGSSQRIAVSYHDGSDWIFSPPVG
jgi:hypothetical protein